MLSKDIPTLIIDAERPQKGYLKDLLHYRELFYFFAWRDVLVRYKEAFFGVSWALIRPILNMVIFAFLFGKVANLPSENINYGLFVLAGLLPWQLFSNSAIDTCNSLINHAHLISKVYFPRMIISTASIMIHLFDFLIAASLLIFLVLFTQGLYWAFLLTFPLLITLSICLCVGVGLWLSALTAQYRDFRLLIPFLVQFGMFVSPVGYGTFVIPEQWQLLYCLNPIVGVIDGFRWVFFGMTYPNLWLSLCISIAITGLILLTGFYYFRHIERRLADMV